MEILTKFPEGLAEELENVFRYPKFNWNYIKSTVEDNDFIPNSDTVDSPFMCHQVYGMREGYISEHSQLIMKVLESQFLEFTLVRCQVNLIINKGTDPNRYLLPHVDSVYDGVKTLLYYVNDSDGDTFVFNEKYNPENPVIDKVTISNRYSPKKGTAVLFDSNLYHAGSNPILSIDRIAINFIFKPL